MSSKMVEIEPRLSIQKAMKKVEVSASWFVFYGNVSDESMVGNEVNHEN